MKAIERSKLVELRVNVGIARGGTPGFNLERELIGKLITGIELVTSTQLVTSPNGEPVVTGGESTNMLLTLLEDSNKRHDQIPLPMLNPALTGGIWKEFVPFVCNVQGSYITLSAVVGNVAPIIVPFMWHYMDPPAGYR